MDISLNYEQLLINIAQHLTADWEVTDRATYAFTWRQFSCLQWEFRRQGWKIHVSASASESLNLLKDILPVLIDNKATFKIPSTVAGIVKINAGEAGLIQAGKILTIYPGSDDHARRVAFALKEVWANTAGPMVLSDAHIIDAPAISFRYGVFLGTNIVADKTGRYDFGLQAPDGSIEIDDRNWEAKAPAWAPPPPYDGLVVNAKHKQTRLCIDNKEFMKIATLQQSPSGTVFLGVSLETGACVVIKTTLKGIGGDLQGYDRQFRFQNECKILQKMVDAKIAPAPFGICHDGEIALVVEDLGGSALSNLSQEEKIASLKGLATALCTLHSLGIVHHDLKLANAIKLDAEGRVALIDFELAGIQPPGVTECLETHQISDRT